MSVELKFNSEVCLFVKSMLLTTVNHCLLGVKHSRETFVTVYLTEGRAGGSGDIESGQRSCQVLD